MAEPKRLHLPHCSAAAEQWGRPFAEGALLRVCQLGGGQRT